MLILNLACTLVVLTLLTPHLVMSADFDVVRHLNKRSLGGRFKDWYLMKMTKNFFCTQEFRVVPIDPSTGHMLTKGLRRRGLDELAGLTPETEKGECKNPTWVLPAGWTQPIPITQFEQQYPWMYVDDRGQMHFKPDYLEYLKQVAAAKAAAGIGQPGAAAGSAPGEAPGGLLSYIPNTVAAEFGYTPGANLGNGITAGAVAHV